MARKNHALCVRELGYCVRALVPRYSVAATWVYPTLVGEYVPSVTTECSVRDVGLRVEFPDHTASAFRVWYSIGDGAWQFICAGGSVKQALEESLSAMAGVIYKYEHRAQEKAE